MKIIHKNNIENTSFGCHFMCALDRDCWSRSGNCASRRIVQSICDQYSITLLLKKIKLGDTEQVWSWIVWIELKIYRKCLPAQVSWLFFNLFSVSPLGYIILNGMNDSEFVISRLIELGRPWMQSLNERKNDKSKQLPICPFPHSTNASGFRNNRF